LLFPRVDAFHRNLVLRRFVFVYGVEKIVSVEASDKRKREETAQNTIRLSNQVLARGYIVQGRERTSSIQFVHRVTTTIYIRKDSLHLLAFKSS